MKYELGHQRESGISDGEVVIRLGTSAFLRTWNNTAFSDAIVPDRDASECFHLLLSHISLTHNLVPRRPLAGAATMMNFFSAIVETNRTIATQPCWVSYDRRNEWRGVLWSQRPSLLDNF